MATKTYQGTVEINGKRYHARMATRQAIAEWPEAAPTETGRSRFTRRFLQSWEIETTRGLLVDRDYDGDLVMAYDSTLETRFGYQVTLPGVWKSEASWNYKAVASVQQDIKGGVPFDSEIWVIHGFLDGATEEIVARRFDETGTPAWDVTEEVISSGATAYVPHDLKAHGAYLFAAFSTSATTTAHIRRRSIGSSTWSNPLDAALKGAIADDGGGQTDETTAANSAAASPPMTLLPAIPAVNDAYYFSHTEKWSTLRLNIGTAGVGTWTITWEYPILVGGTVTWVALPGVNDATTGFTVSGTKNVGWNMPQSAVAPASVEWIQTAVKGISAYWVRARVSAYTSVTTPPLGTQAWVAGWRDDMANAGDKMLMCSVDRRLYLASWNSSTGVVTMEFSTDNGASWVVTETTKGQVTSTFAPNAFVAYADDDGNSMPHLGCAEGVWRYDLNGETPTLVVDLHDQVSEHNCRGMVPWAQSGALYIPLALAPWGQILEYKLQGGVRILTQMGLDQGSGLPAARQGHVIDLRPAGQWLFALLRNDSTYESSILAWDGYGWHHIFNSNTTTDGATTEADIWPTGSPDPQLICFSNVDTTWRLHLLWLASGTVADSARLENPLHNPLSVTNFDYAASGYIDLARYAAGLPEIDAVWLRSHVDADDLSATTAGEYIKLDYGKDGEARTVNNLGNFLSGTKSLSFASNAGVSSKTFAPRLTLYRDRGTAGGTEEHDSPKLYSFVQEFLKVPLVRHIWRVLIDIEQSAQPGSRPPEQVVSDLEALEASTAVVQVTFSVANEAQIYVKPLPPSPQWQFELVGHPDPLETIPRTGTVEVVLIELLA